MSKYKSLKTKKDTAEKIHELMAMETEGRSTNTLLDYLVSNWTLCNLRSLRMFHQCSVLAKIENYTKDFSEGKIDALEHAKLCDSITDKEQQRLEAIFNKYKI